MNHRQAVRVFVMFAAFLSQLGFAVTIYAQTGKQPEVTISNEYYQVSGNTFDVLRKQMHDYGPVDKTGRHGDAYTDWYVNWSYPYAEDPKGYRTGPIEVKVTIKYILPKWITPQHVPKEKKHEWGRFLQALQIHEDEHKAIATEVARQILEALEGLQAYPTKDELEKHASSTAQQLLEKAREKEIAYDRKTNHGATQGARLQ